MGAAEPTPRVTPRAIIIGLALLPLTCWWLIAVEFVRYTDTPTIPQLYFHCLALLALLAAVNGGVRRWWPAAALTRVELLGIYLMQVIGSNLAGHDQLQVLFSTIVSLHQQATPENQWATWLEPHVPRRLLVTDPAALHDLFRGHSSLYAAGHWRAWLVPLGLWSLIVLTVAATLYCCAALLRKSWDQERLTYPLADIPLVMTEASGALYRTLAFRLGAGLAASLQFLNLGHQIWPAVPGVNLGVRLLTFKQLPWSAAGSIPICYFPFAFGLAFLLPVNLSFSCWFFFLFTKLERIVAAQFGFTQWDGFPYVNQQHAGAFVGFGLLVVWSARRQLATTWRQALGRAPEPADGEPLSSRAAWGGLLLGLAALLVFSTAAGLRPWVALVYWALLVSIILAVARIRAEVGLPSTELYERGADDILRRVGGSAAYRPGELAVMTLFYWLQRTHRNYPLLHQLHGLRIVRRADGALGSVTWPILLATIVGIICGFWAMLQVTYQVGFEGARFAGPAPTAFGVAPWARLASLLQRPLAADRGGTVAYGVGAGITGLLVMLRARCLWWPLHPAGWVVANSFALQRLWVPLSATWALKAALLRYGGLARYRQVLPFFAGLVVGEFCAGFARTLIDLAWHLALPAEAGLGGL